MSYSPKPAFVQPSLRTYWETVHMLLLGEGIVRETATSAGSWTGWRWAVSWLWLSPTPKDLTWPYPECTQTGNTFSTSQAQEEIKGTRLAERATLRWVALSPQGSQGAAFLNMNAIDQESALLGACSCLRNPPATSQRSPKSNSQILGTDSLLFIWNTSQRFLCWMSSASENFHSDLLRKTWPKNFW